MSHDDARRALMLSRLHRSVEAKEEFVRQAGDLILDLAERMITVFRQGGKLLIFGNGGSAADAQHMAAELVNRFLIDRSPLPAVALTTDSSILTAIGNDFSYDEVFVKQVEALGRAGDMALAISTSGNSANVLRAVRRAAGMGLVTAGLTGGSGGGLAACCDICLTVPATATPHVQEVHLWVEHLLCEIVEQELFAGQAP